MAKLIVKAVRKKKERKPTKPEILATQGLKYYNFIWPIDIITALCAGHNEAPNVYILRLIEEEIKRRGA